MDIGAWQYPWEPEESGMEMRLNQISSGGSEVEKIAVIL